MILMSQVYSMKYELVGKKKKKKRFEKRDLRRNMKILRCF